MASTLNLFALDRDSPASRQLHVAVEDNAGTGKNENRLLVTDNKAVEKLEIIENNIINTFDKLNEIKNEIHKPKLSYFKTNLFINNFVDITTSSAEDDTLSRFVDVSRVDKINIYYEDVIVYNPTYVTLTDYRVLIYGLIPTIGIIGENATDPFNGLLISNNPLPINNNTINYYNTYIEIGSFLPSDKIFFSDNDGNVNNERSFIFYDFNVNGITAIYLKIEPVGSLTTEDTAEENTTIAFNPSAFVSGHLRL